MNKILITLFGIALVSTAFILGIALMIKGEILAGPAILVLAISMGTQQWKDK